MADGRIKIAIEVDGKEVNVASKELDKLESNARDSGQGIKQAEKSMDGLADSASDAAKSTKEAADETKKYGEETRKGTSNTKKFAAAVGLIAVASAAFKVLKDNLDAAIERFDTLNRFPKVLQALGVSAEESERATQKLADGIEGLPTTLNDIASVAQRMYTSFNDMDKATDSALALNNALLGSGASAEDARRGTEQYLKALQTGKMEMDTWNTLSETMDVGLVKIAEGFGFAGKSAKQDLYNALKDGTITMDEFNDMLIEVGTGTGIMARLAKENSLGIQTSWQNLKNAFAIGIANIIDSFNRLSKEVTGKDIAQNIDSLKFIVRSAFDVIQRVIESTIPFFKGFANVIKGTIPIVEALTPAILGLMAAYAAHTVITKVSAAIKASNAILAAAVTSQKALTLAKNVDTVATAKNTGAITLSNAIIGVLTGKLKLSTAATIAKTAATTALSTALRFLTGPVGWVTAGIGALAAGAVAVVKWFNRSTEEAKRLNAETEELSGSTSQLADNIESNAKSYQDQQREIQASAEATQNLVRRIEELSEKENKSASDKVLLQSYIDQLNGSVEGLNLSYNEQADALNMSSEELQTRVDLMKDEESLIASQDRLLEIDKERNEVQMQLDKINELREDWNQKLEEGTVKSGEYQDAIAELDEQEQLLKQTLAELAEQYGITEEEVAEAIGKITQATEEGVASQKLAYDRLEDHQKEVVDNMKSKWDEYADAATEMFDTLSDEVEITASEMADNLEENQRIISEWADNIAILAERGVDEGLLDKLREAGPESAGHVNALVNASDEELERLNDVFSKGGETATEALAKSLGMENDPVFDAISDLVVDTEKSLREQIQSADFESIGVDLGTGLASGIDSGSPEAEKSAAKMAVNVTGKTREAFRTHSPSREFMDIGGDLTDGLALGIQRGTVKVIQAIQQMFRIVQRNSVTSFRGITRDYERAVQGIRKSLNKLPQYTQTAMRNMQTRLKIGRTQNVNIVKRLAGDMIRQFNRTPSQFNSIGRSAMAGLNAGLNAGRGRVLNTARSIANSVASTMKSALRIQSPSKIMRDEVGRWIPAGLAEGIEKYANLVDKATSDMFSYTTPEVALGTSRMAYTGGVSQIVNNYHTSAPSNKPVTSNPLTNKPATIVIQTNGRQWARAHVDDLSVLLQDKVINASIMGGG